MKQQTLVWKRECLDAQSAVGPASSKWVDRSDRLLADSEVKQKVRLKCSVGAPDIDLKISLLILSQCYL